MKKLNKEQILLDFFRKDETVDNVNIIWLQNELRTALIQQTELKQCKDTINKLRLENDSLKARIELTELLNCKSGFTFDERC